jgi:hypothetical protein
MTSNPITTEMLYQEMAVSFFKAQTLVSDASLLIARLAAFRNKVYLVWQEGAKIDPNNSASTRSDEEKLDAEINAHSAIKYRISSDYGNVFGEMATFYQCNIAQYVPPAMEMSPAGRVFLAWGDGNKEATDSVVFFCRSNDDGSGFEDPVIINNKDDSESKTTDSSAATTISSRKVSAESKTEGVTEFDEKRKEFFRRGYLVPRVKLAAAGDNVYIFWSETKGQLYTDVEYRLFFRASNDGGRTFGSKKIIGTTTVKASEFLRMFQINLTASGDEVYMMWIQFTPVPGYMFSGRPNPLKAYVAISRNAGKTLERTIDLSEDTIVVQGDRQENKDDASGDRVGRTRRSVFEKLPFEIVAAGEGVLYMVLIGHESYGQRDFLESLMRFRPSTEGGKTTPVASNAANPNLLDINLPIYFAKSVDYGSSFTNPVYLEDYSAGIDDTYLLRSDKDVHVIWRAVAQGGVLMSRTSTDGGKSFQPTVQIPKIKIFHPTGSPSNSGAIITSPNGRIFIAMRKDIQSRLSKPLEPDSEMFFSASFDAGMTFTDTTRLSENPGGDSVHNTCVYPSIYSVNGKYVYIAWSEIQNGSSFSLKFRKGIIQ